MEDAVECYQRAANLFKMAKNWAQAGSAFCEAANLHSKAGSKHDAATNYVDAANCYKKCEVEGKYFFAHASIKEFFGLLIFQRLSIVCYELLKFTRIWEDLPWQQSTIKALQKCTKQIR